MKVPLRTLLLAVGLVAAVGAAGARAPGTRAPMVMRRPGQALAALGPDARVDLGLQAAAEELAAAATSADARLTPTATRLALARAGYPGDARFLLARGGTEPPAALLQSLPRNEPIDVGWASRAVGDASTWIVGWAPRRVEMDPVTRDLDGKRKGVSLRVDGASEPRLLVESPTGTVEERAITDGVARWVDHLDIPGEYRVEVVDHDRVELLFSLFVGASPPPLPPLPGRAARPDPDADLPMLYAAVDRLRADAGLPALRRFPAFEPHARAHAACLAAAGVVAHATPTCPGVPELARRTHFPAARHTEDVAAGDTAEEAWERVLASPGHVANLLCKTCTHLSIGATLEGADPARLYAVWEILEFPQGEPEPIPNRK